APISVLDIDSSATTNDPYGDFKTQFQAAKAVVAAAAIAGGATDGGAAAVLDAYHSTLVPPFCLAAVSAFFEAQ
ncbi:MAG: alpha/beta hydrolase, partial [Steroidobacteraceae bacterium]